MSSPAPPKEYTTEEIRSMHGEEADQIGWRMVFNAGEVTGDLTVSILPPVHRVSALTHARSYLYRRNVLTGKHFLVKKS